MQTKTTRRALLGGTVLAVTSAAISASAGLAAAPSGAGIRPDFAAAHAAIAQAEAAMRAHHPVFHAARARWTVAVAAVPHVEFHADRGVTTGGLRYTTADPLTVQVCEGIVKRGGRNAIPIARRLVAAQRWRERRLSRLGRETGMDAAYDRDDVLGSAVAAAEDAFLDMRPMTIAELRLSVETIDARGLWPTEDVPQRLAADVLRLTWEGR